MPTFYPKTENEFTNLVFGYEISIYYELYHVRSLLEIMIIDTAYQQYNYNSCNIMTYTSNGVISQLSAQPRKDYVHGF